MRKRNTLDTSEANFVFSKILLMINHDERAKDLPIPVKNNLIDSVALKAISKANHNKDDVEAIYFEFNSYKLSEEERKEALSEKFYDKIPKYPNFNEMLTNKYNGIISEIFNDELTQLTKSLS